MGHNAEILTGHARGLFGRGQIIQKLPGGVWAGGSDPRAEYVSLYSLRLDDWVLIMARAVVMLFRKCEVAISIKISLGHFFHKLRAARVKSGILIYDSIVNCKKVVFTMRCR